MILLVEDAGKGIYCSFDVCWSITRLFEAWKASVFTVPKFTKKLFETFKIEPFLSLDINIFENFELVGLTFFKSPYCMNNQKLKHYKDLLKIELLQGDWFLMLRTNFPSEFEFPTQRFFQKLKDLTYCIYFQ